ncbi:MAG: hypothetical protein KIT31_15690 [Deltaproteobacteria bacterium]|nr:hypothetical protein [Deltaproteobacteria bacterium]
MKSNDAPLTRADLTQLMEANREANQADLKELRTDLTQLQADLKELREVDLKELREEFASKADLKELREELATTEERLGHRIDMIVASRVSAMEDTLRTQIKGAGEYGDHRIEQLRNDLEAHVEDPRAHRDR